VCVCIYIYVVCWHKLRYCIDMDTYVVTFLHWKPVPQVCQRVDAKESHGHWWKGWSTLSRKSDWKKVPCCLCRTKYNLSNCRQLDLVSTLGLFSPSFSIPVSPILRMSYNLGSYLFKHCFVQQHNARSPKSCRFMVSRYFIHIFSYMVFVARWSQLSVRWPFQKIGHGGMFLTGWSGWGYCLWDPQELLGDPIKSNEFQVVTCSPGERCRKPHICQEFKSSHTKLQGV
jgi:hypothetical protein